jgi:tetratricopeptide (TPR) repeat protein
MARRLCKLEAAEGGRSILNGYDRNTDQWSYSFDGPFWKAVEHAHSLGKRGAGARVAIIDSACDLTIPALRDRVNQLIRCVPCPPPEEDTEHGSAVALLIAKVAPDCRFDVYAVRRSGDTIYASDVAIAIGKAASSEASILNLSLGTAEDVVDLDKKLDQISRDARVAFLSDPAPQHGKWMLANEILPDPNCEVCDGSSAAARSGKMIFAAAGNDASEISCPARAQEVFAAGFQVMAKRIVLPGPDGGRQIETTAPVGEQSLFVDLPLEEVSGVLGTSFASPMYAGVAALGATAAELACYVAALPMTSNAIEQHNAIKKEVARLGHSSPETGPRYQQVCDLYLNALRRLPHVHSQLEFVKRFSPAGFPITDPSTCFACGLFAYPLYVNFGLFLLEHGFFKDAKVLLEVARAIAPWSDEAAADLGRTLEALGDLEGALSLYNTATSLRPGVQPYEVSRERIKAELGNR